MVPEWPSRKWGDWVNGVAHKASSGVGIQGQHERDEEMMRVPEGFICLLTNAMMGGGVDQHHAQKHDMARDTTCPSKVNLNGQFRADMVFFDIVETRILLAGQAIDDLRTEVHT